MVDVAKRTSVQAKGLIPMLVGYHGSVTERLKWWNQHLPHDRVVWDGWAATLVYNKIKAGEDVHRPQCAIDVDACATYLAQRTSPRVSFSTTVLVGQSTQQTF